MSFALRSLKSSSALRVSPRLTVNARQFHCSPSRAEQFLNANAETFEKVVLNTTAKDKITLVDFYADWCAPCRMLSPILESLAEDTSVKTGSGASLDLVTVDTDQEVGLGRTYEIRSLPTVIAFKDGKPIDQFVGALNAAGVRHFLEKL